MNRVLILDTETTGLKPEDGIRDRSPSRGLGDVYKRQEARRILAEIDQRLTDLYHPVSYTHLTLPTNREV